ncbi:unnamed protein product, partial [Ectocarpus sp. 12 AP-2014]
GKEVALFVQEHMAKELVKLEEYRGGDYPRALARVFHRMDELLEGAATELVRSRGPSQRMLPDGRGGGETSRASGGAQQLLTQGESGRSEAETGVEDDVTKDKGGEEEEKETRSEEKEGGTAGVADMETETASAELYKVICQELAEYRARKNPSDEEAEEPPLKAATNPILGSGQDYDSDEEDAGVDGAGSSGRHRNRKDEVGVVDASSADSGENDVLELGSGGPNGGGGGRKIKMADALELFHRILDIRKDQQRNAAAAAAVTTGGGSDPTSVGDGRDDDASTCPTPLPSDTACDGGGKPRGGGSGSEQVAPSEGGMGGEAVSAGEPGGSGEGVAGAAAASAAVVSPAEEEEEDEEGEERDALLPTGGA